MTDKTGKKRSRRDDMSDSTSLAPPSYNMYRDFEDLMQPFDEFIQPLVSTWFGPFWSGPRWKEPNIDVQDRGDHYVLTAQLPGFDKKDIEVRISDNVLELKGEKSEKEVKSDGSTEVSASSYIQRHMTLPEEVVSERVSGTMKNGILELKLPKRVNRIPDRSKKVDLK